MKKWILILAVAVCLAVPAAAAQPETHAARDWDVLFARYGVQTASAIPAGVRPLRIDTPAEFRQLLESMTSHGTCQLVLESENTGLLSYGVTQSCVSLRKTVSWIPFPTFNLWADVWIAGSGSFWEIVDVEEWVGLTGITVFADLTDTWHYHIVAADHRSVFIRGGGVVNHYFVIKGLIKVLSEPVALSISYSLR